MGKNKLKKFAEMETFPNVFQCTAGQMELEGSVAAMAGHWCETYFHNANPIVLELGCGRGEYTVGLAARCPEKNFIGIDIKGARMWAGAKEAIAQGLPNVAFLRTNIEMLARFFAPDEVDEIWITFCDPQMKKATKRLTSTYFMQRYQEVMREGGLIHLKTDSPFLYTYTREMLRLNGYPVAADTDDLYNTNSPAPFAGRGQGAGQFMEVRSPGRTIELAEARMLQTHYEKQWLDRGMTIKYLAWNLPHKTDFQEPEIEIEKDTYRSYGRNYNSNC
ncbi:MAG: tRNA (guanosine(46)-N7)-methyltransferase TrmB [Paludibacteraceae bacterium]